MTADASKLRELADRCEREGPSYALDCKIEHLCDPERARLIGNAKLYTTSLDAAVTLVPEGLRWCVGPLPLDRGGANASVWGDSRNLKECAFNIEGRTPALALCAAALRARASLAEPHVEATP